MEQGGYTFVISQLKSNIKLLRQMSGKTIAEIAEKANSTRESIYRWEDVSDSRCPSINSIVDLCNIYNVDITTLLFTKISDRNKDMGFDTNKPNIKDGVPLSLSSFPKVFMEFYKSFMSELENKIVEVNGIKINKITVVPQSYIAFKILKQDNTLKKPLHFLTIYPNLNRKTFRFVFATSKDNISSTQNDKSPAVSESAQNLLSDDSRMGAYFTIGYRQRFLGLDNHESVSELFIRAMKEPTFTPDIDDIVTISLKTLWLVIEGKRD